MTVCQKLGVILESKVVQKLRLEKKCFFINRVEKVFKGGYQFNFL